MSLTRTASSHTPDWLAKGQGIDRVVPSTEAQMEVWLADQISPAASLAFNESITLWFDGELDVQALRLALDALVARHDALRSTVGADGSEFIVSSAASRHWPVHEHADEAPVQAAQHAAVSTPFDLSHGPLFRAELHRCGAQRAALVLAAHHLVCDGWSWGVLVQDLADLYAEALGVAPTPAPAASLADFAQWSADQARSSERQAAQAFWLSRFDRGSVPVLDLPIDRTRPAQRRFDSYRVDRVWPAERVKALTRLAQTHGRSLHATAFTSFVVWLARLADQDDIVVGVPWAAQAAFAAEARSGELNGRENHTVIGHGVHLLPVRCAVNREEAFSAQLARTGTQLLDALDHPGLTYGTLLRRLQIPRDPARPTLVAAMFNLDSALPVGDWFEGLHTTLQTNPRTHENYELFANLVPLSDGSLRVELQAQATLFDVRTIEQWLDAWETLVDAACADAATPVGRLPWVSSQALKQLRSVQGSRDLSLPTRALMHTQVLEQIRRTPTRTALIWQGEALSYAALGQASYQLAAVLLSRGVRPGDHVGICLPRGLDMVVAVLAVLRTGAAYVPLDPEFPASRLGFMARDAQLALLLTASTVEVAPRFWGTGASERTLNLDQLEANLPSATDAASWAQVDAPVPADQAAYLLYTSGSTGQPKGVVVPHRAVANFLASMTVRPGMHADDRLAAVTTLSFDISVLELWLPLTVGACSVLVPRDTVLDGAALSELLQREGISVMQATPGVWRMLIEAGWGAAGQLTALVGGEALPVDLAEALLDRCATVWNLYGPTETTVWSTAWRVDRAALRAGGMAQGVSIGSPIDHTDCWVLDAQQQPVPTGVVGELWIGGRGVATGYWQRETLTSERFVVEPFVADPLVLHPLVSQPNSDDPGPEAAISVETKLPARLYRTGDRARWRADGRLEHLGRLDYQVKVRGYRIELGEIEAACLSDPSVAEAVVLAREDQPGDVRLVAYLVSPTGESLQAERLAKALQQRLPTHMQPQQWVALTALPRLPNGKTDRRSLPAPSAADGLQSTSASGPSEARRAPRDDREKAVLDTMEALLDLPGLSIDDDFFAMGGHSLLAARLATRLAGVFEVRLPMRTIFEARTAAALADALRRQSESDKASGSDHLQPLRHDPSRSVAPLTPAQDRIVRMEALHPGRSLYNTPSAHRLRGPMNVGALEGALNDLIARQPSLRTAFGTVPGRVGTWQRIAPELRLTLPVVDMQEVPASDREAVLMQRLQQAADAPIDIAQAPLLHTALYVMGPEDHVLLFTPHHLIWDGWSFDVFYVEMAAAYTARTQSAGLAAPHHGREPLRASPADWSAWLADWMHGSDCDAQLAWWRQQYAQAPALRAPTTDRPRRPGMTGRGGTEWVHIDRRRTDQLHALAKRWRLTLSSLLLTTYGTLLAQVFGHPHWVVGVPARGRLMPELEGVTGFFNNLLPLHLSLPEAANAAPVAAVPIQQVALQVQQRAMDALSHQEAPFERWATEPEVAARAQRDGGLYQTLFSFQDARERIRHWGRLEQTNLLLHPKVATEDLGLWLMELPSGLEGGLTFHADLYHPSTARALRSRYLELIDKLLAAPDGGWADWADPTASAAATELAHLGPGGSSAARSDSEADIARPATPSAEQATTQTTSSTPPATDGASVREQVATIWSDLLGLPTSMMLPQDNFFDLGGQSLLAVTAASRLEAHFGIAFDTRRLIYESLGQIAATLATEPKLASRAKPVTAPLTPTTPSAQPGLVGRLLGRWKPGSS